MNTFLGFLKNKRIHFVVVYGLLLANNNFKSCSIICRAMQVYDYKGDYFMPIFSSYFFFPGPPMRDVHHGDGAVLQRVPHAGRVRGGSLLGHGNHPPSPHREVRPALEIHSAGNQHSDTGDHFLHMVREKQSGLKKK